MEPGLVLSEYCMFCWHACMGVPLVGHVVMYGCVVGKRGNGDTCKAGTFFYVSYEDPLFSLQNPQPSYHVFPDPLLSTPFLTPKLLDHVALRPLQLHTIVEALEVRMIAEKVDVS
eukprot:1159755-Pelagomonas_calceolata.AAC.7